MEQINNLLKEIYNNEDLKELENEVQKLIEEYSENFAPANYQLTHKDIVLITYGDQVKKEGESKLQTLNKLLNETLKEEISIVHLLPFYPYCSDDGFSVIDFYKVNPDLGTWNDIDTISKSYKLIFDAVINHTSSKCNWFIKFLEGDEKYKDYYIEVNDLSPFKNVTRPRTSPLVHTFVKNNVKKNVWTTFSKEQVDLNFKNPRVFIQIIDLLLFYITKGAKIIRLDAVGFLWKEKNTTCINLPQTHLLIKAIRKIIEKFDSSVQLLSETNVPHTENISYFGNGDEAHMVYNFTLPPLLAYSLLTGEVKKLVDWARTLEVSYERACFFNFLASHDGVGLRPVNNILSEDDVNVLISSAKSNGGKISYKQNSDGSKTPYEINCNYYSMLKGNEKNEKLGIQRTILAHAVLLSMPGIPAIYFHSVFGSENDIKGVEETGIFRRINRQKFDYDNLTKKLKNTNSRESKILSALKKIMKVKKQDVAFDPYGKFIFDSPADGVFCIQRISKNNDSIVKAIYNFGFNSVSLKLIEEGKDLLSEKSYVDSLYLSPLQFVWLKIK